jgi:hypothetical protein
MAMYGAEGVLAHPACWVEDVALERLGDQRVASTEKLYAAVQQALQGGGAA